MPKDVIITPASGLIDFQGNTGISSATIQLDNNGNLNIANPSGDLTIGSADRDVYIGDGINNVDIIFEQSGEIRALTGKTLSIGQTDSYVRVAGQLLGEIDLIEGPLLIGTGTSTGTASQRLQVTGGAYVSGNLGVGNANPGAQLDVAGDVRLSGAGPEIEFNASGPRLYSPAANTLTIHTGGGLNSTTNEAVRINTTGVGIRTTNPVSPLEVAQDTTGVHDLTVTNLNTGNNITKASRIRFRLTDSVGTKKDVAYITAYTYNLDSSAGNYLSFFTRTLDSNPTEKMRLDNNGNLVLGSSFTPTGTASQPLQVTGGAYVSGNLGVGLTNPANHYGSDHSLVVQKDQNSVTKVSVTNATSGASAGSQYRMIGGTANSFAEFNLFDNSGSPYSEISHGSAVNTFLIRLTGSERLRINSSGNLLIGSTTDTGTASQRLQVTGGAYVSGNLGVGITNPGESLVVFKNQNGSHFSEFSNPNSGSASYAGLKLSSSGGSAYFFLNSSARTTDGGVNNVTIRNDAGDIRLQPANGFVDQSLGILVKGTTGNTGIGTINPTQSLHVQGNARITGAIYDSTNSAGTSGQVLQSTITGTQWTTAAAGGGSGTFDTGITTSVYISAISGLGIGTAQNNDIFVGPGIAGTAFGIGLSFPSTAGREYVIESIHVTNTYSNELYLNARHDFNTGSNTWRSVPIAQRLVVPYQGSLEIINQPMIANPQDHLRFQAMSGVGATATGIDGGLDVFTVYSTKTDTNFVGVGTTVASTSGAEVYRSTTYPSVVQSIRLCNYNLNIDVDASVSIYRGGTAGGIVTTGVRLGYLVYNMTIPKNSIVEILEKPKYLAVNDTIVAVGSTINSLSACVSAKLIV